jgi:hypothetical protein
MALTLNLSNKFDKKLFLIYYMGRPMRERIIIVFIALAIGLLITTLLFFLYQQTKISPKKITQYGTTPAPQKDATPAVPLTVDEPSDFAISDRRTIEVKGKTAAANTIIVSTNQEDVVTTPSGDGKFSISITIDSGTNKVVTRAIAPNGENSTDVRVVTYSTEEF